MRWYCWFLSIFTATSSMQILSIRIGIFPKQLPSRMVIVQGGYRIDRSLEYVTGSWVIEIASDSIPWSDWKIFALIGSVIHALFAFQPRWLRIFRVRFDLHTTPTFCASAPGSCNCKTPRLNWDCHDLSSPPVVSKLKSHLATESSFICGKRMTQLLFGPTGIVKASGIASPLLLGDLI